MDCDNFFIEMMCIYVSEGKEDDLVEFLQKEVFFYVKVLKDQGNYLFKKDNFQVVRGCYEKVFKFFLCILFFSNGRGMWFKIQ